jgi:hypothetical protein
MVVKVCLDLLFDNLGRYPLGSYRESVFVENAELMSNKNSDC